MSAVSGNATAPVWQHQETDPERGVALALSLADGPAAVTGMDQPTRMHALRCLAAMTVFACQAAQGPAAIPPLATPGEGQIPVRSLGNLDGALYPSREAKYVASTLARSLILIPDRFSGPVYPCVTKDGEPAQLGPQPLEGQDTGFPWALIVVAGVAACCVAACWIAGRICDAENINRKMEIEADSARVIAAQAGALGLIHEHQEREREARKALPWDPVVLRQIDALNGIQHDIVTRQRQPWPTPFRGAIDALGGGGAIVGGSLTTVALILGTAFVLTR